MKNCDDLLKQKDVSDKRKRKAKFWEKGSLALEQILFIGAIVALSAGLYVFYDNLSNYFSNVGFSTPPSDIGATSGGNSVP